MQLLGHLGSSSWLTICLWPCIRLCAQQGVCSFLSLCATTPIHLTPDLPYHTLCLSKINKIFKKNYRLEKSCHLPKDKKAFKLYVAIPSQDGASGERIRQEWEILKLVFDTWQGRCRARRCGRHWSTQPTRTGGWRTRVGSLVPPGVGLLICGCNQRRNWPSWGLLPEPGHSWIV